MVLSHLAQTRQPRRKQVFQTAKRNGMGEAAPGFPPTPVHISASLPSSWSYHCQTAPSALTPLLTSASPGSKEPLRPDTTRMSATAWKGRCEGWGRGSKRGKGNYCPGQLSSTMIPGLDTVMLAKEVREPLISFEVKQHTMSLGRTEEVCLGRVDCDVRRWGASRGRCILLFFVCFLLLHLKER